MIWNSPKALTRGVRTHNYHVLFCSVLFCSALSERFLLFESLRSCVKLKVESPYKFHGPEKDCIPSKMTVYISQKTFTLRFEFRIHFRGNQWFELKSFQLNVSIKLNFLNTGNQRGHSFTPHSVCFPCKEGVSRATLIPPLWLYQINA